MFVSVNYDPYAAAGTKLTVTEPGLKVTEPAVEVLKPSAKECKDTNKKRKKTLVCVASQFYPDHVSMSWRLNGVQTDKGVATGRAIRRSDKSYSITSRLKVQAKDWFRPGNNFTCMVGFYNGNKTTFHSGSVISTDRDNGMTRDKYLRITQNAKLSYIVLIVKSSVYGAAVCLLVWKLQSSAGEQNK